MPDHLSSTPPLLPSRTKLYRMGKAAAGILFAGLTLFSAAPSVATLQVPGAAGLEIANTDWPWWRGASRNGHAMAQNVPIQWNENENILWSAPIPGRGHGSPTVVGENIFLATADEKRKTQSVVCLDRTNGKQKWITQLHTGGWQGRIHQRNTQASSTVACDGERLFATFMHDEKIWLSALSLNGEILWQVKTGDYVSHWGYSSSPAIYESLVIVASDHKAGGNLSAFDRQTGKPVWNTSRPAIPNYASPAIFNIGGRDQIILPGCEMMASYHPRSGRMLWSAPVTTQETVGTAVADENRVYASGGYPKNETACVLADGSSELVWRNSIRVYAPSMLVANGYLYTMTDKGLAHCWNAETGQMMWREKVGGDFSASPVLVGDTLYVSSEQGKTVVFKANPDQFELLAENQLGDEVWASPVICNDRIYLRVAHHEEEGRQEVLYCLGG